MTKKLQESQHRKTSILQFIKLELFQVWLANWFFANVEVSKEAIVVSGANEEEHLQPSKGWDCFNGSDTVGDIGECYTRSDFTRETEDFWNNVTDHSKHADTSVFELGSTVSFKGLGINVRGEPQRVCSANITGNQELVDGTEISYRLDMIVTYQRIQWERQHRSRSRMENR